MQVRRAQPNAVERQVCVPKSFSEMAESPWVASIETVLGHSQFFCVRIKPVAVGANFLDRHDITDIFAAEIPAIASVTICAVLRVKFFALGAELVIDCKRIFGRLVGKQPLLD